MNDAQPSVVIQFDPGRAWEALPLTDRARWIGEIADFPPPPLMLELLQQDLRLDSYDPARLAAKLAGDPVLTARILARANSAAFARTSPALSLHPAMVSLGFNLVRSTMLRYQIEQSALKLAGGVRAQILALQRAADRGATLAYNWARALSLPAAADIATSCLLARLGTFLLARRAPQQLGAYFAAQSETERLAWETTVLGVATPTLTWKVAQAWALPDELQRMLGALWTPLVADCADRAAVIACAALALGSDPLPSTGALEQQLGLPAYCQLADNLAAVAARAALGGVIDSRSFQSELASLDDVPY